MSMCHLSSSMIQQRPSLVPVNPEFMVNMRMRISPSHPGIKNLQMYYIVGKV